MIARTALIVLLFMNIAAAAWWSLRQPAESQAPAATEPGIPALVLLAEAERQGLPAAELAMAPLHRDAAPLCLAIGPFDTPSALRRAVASFGQDVARLQFREAQVKTVRGWRVSLPPAASRAQALEQARALAARGIRDYYVVTAGPAENSIALGLFRQRENADARLAELRELGVEALLTEASAEHPQWWLEIAVAANFDWRTPLGGQAADARPIPCF